MSSSTKPKPKSKKQQLDEAIRLILENNFDADSKTCFLTLLKIIDNLLKSKDPKVRSLKTSNAAIRSKIIDKKGHHVLMACGFVLEEATVVLGQTTRDERLVLEESGEDTDVLVHARHTLARIAVLELNVKADSIPTFQPPIEYKLRQSTDATGRTSLTTNTTGFDVYSGRRFDGQSAALGTNLGPPANWQSKTEQELALLKAREAKLERDLQQRQKKQQQQQQTTRSMDRQWTVILPGQQASSSSSSSASTMTAPTQTSRGSVGGGDSQLLASHFQKQHAARKAADNRGFTTKAMRDLEKLKKTKIYSHTQLALAFPDGVVVKANFATRETIQAVIDDLSSHVLSSSSSLSTTPLELYQTPPRVVLDPSKSLQDLGLVPAAKIYVGWKKALPKNNTTSSSGWYIRPEHLASTTTSTQQQQRQQPAMPISVPVVPRAAAAGGGSAADGGTTAKRKKTQAEKEAALMKRMLGK